MPKSTTEKLGLFEDKRWAVVDNKQVDLLGALISSPIGFDKVLLDLDALIWFCPNYKTLVGDFEKYKSQINQHGMLWICWCKKSSPRASDINKNLIMQHILDGGLVDVKVASIDSDWSAMKCVFRIKDRKI